MGRRRTPRMTGLNVTHHTLAKIKRIGLRHHKSPPTGSESHSHPRRNPHRFNLTVRCSRAFCISMESMGLAHPPPIARRETGVLPDALCGGGQGWGVARANEAIASAADPLSPRT